MTGKMYGQFATDKKLEKEGIYVQYEHFRVLLGRSGGANKRYTKLLADRARPLRRAIQTETLGDKQAEELLRGTFIDGCVFAWEVWIEDEDEADGGRWESGIELQDGSIAPFNRDNVEATFKALPDLYQDLRSQSEKMALYRQTIMEDTAGN